MTTDTQVGDQWPLGSSPDGDTHRDADGAVLAPRPPATPGPWKACGTVYEHMNAEIRSGAKGQGVAIAQVWDADNGFSNALLLAAAPQLRDSLLLAVSHIEHLAAWISRDNRGYSFEALGEDMATIKAPLRDITESGS